MRSRRSQISPHSPLPFGASHVIYRPYGTTGKEVSLVGFGGMRFKQIEDRERCVEMVVAAAQSGINYFDTAPGYFGARGEEVFGEGFQELRRLGLPFYASTKTFKTSEKQVGREIEAQLRRLKLDAIDFYHVWCILTLGNWRDRVRKGVIQGFRKAKEEGLVRHVCVSSHLAGGDLAELLREELFEGVLFGYSAYNFSFRQAALQAVADRGIGCAVMNPLGGGLIPQNPRIFEFLKTRADQTVVEAGLHFLFAHPQISTVLVGFGELGEVREAVAAVDRFEGVAAAELERMKRNVGEAFRDLCTGCEYCDHCPEGVPVPKLMEAYNHKLLYGTAEAASRRLKMQWNLPPAAAEKCTKCGQCEDACTQHLPITERMRELASLSPVAA